MIYEKEIRKYEKWLKYNTNPSKYSETLTDYQYKSYLLKKNIPREIGSICKNEYLNTLYNAFNISDYYAYSNDTLHIFYDSIAHELGYSSLIESLRINNAKYHRVARLKNRVELLLNTQQAIFLTLTFRDNVLSTTSYETRRQYVFRFLKSLCPYYVANVDYGKRNHREHYHALVSVEAVDHTLWKYGAINFERVSYDETSTTDRLSLYIAKLSNHALKETARRSHLIYSRKST